MKKIAIIGLGYVGLPLAVEFGKIRTVIGFDINSMRVSELKQKNDRTCECSSSEIISAKYLSFTDQIEDIFDCQIYIVTVPTPIDLTNRPDLKFLEAASKIVGSILKPGDTVIYESTVYPGATEEVCVPILEDESHLSYNEDFFCGYSPERINPGDKINRLPNLTKVTSGSNASTANEIDDLYKSIITVGTYKTSSIRVAEAAKVIENCQRDLNIAFVNELSIIFALIGIDTNEVLDAAGTKWNFMPFKPGMVGGHCIGVDPYYLTHKAESLGYHPEVILSGRNINNQMASHAANTIIKIVIKSGGVLSNMVFGVMGITFKENCPDIRNSKVIDLIRELQSWNIKVAVTDPHADPNIVKIEYGIELETIDEENVVDVLILAVGHQDYRDLSPEKLKSFCAPEKPVIADLKALHNKNELESVGFEVYRF
ncbi:nucleotide sugar dehydrogenase [Paracoccaceae bacterium]|nr:nucleotide sugar dehydrogenase [Paracoccaceae bacterium]